MTSGSVDFGYLESFAAGDARVVGEVLELFRTEAAGWLAALDGAGWRDVVHTIKGAGRGVGARVLGDVCEEVEGAGPGDLPRVRAALEAALAEIEAYLARSRSQTSNS